MRVRSRPNGFSDQMVSVCRDENGRRGCRNLSARPQGLREPRAACTCEDRTRPPPRVIPPFQGRAVAFGLHDRTKRGEGADRDCCAGGPISPERSERMELVASTFVDKLMPELSALFDTIRQQSRDRAGVTRDAFGARETQA